MQTKIKQYFQVQYTNYDDSDWITIPLKYEYIDAAKDSIKDSRLTNYSNIMTDYRIVLIQEIQTVVLEE